MNDEVWYPVKNYEGYYEITKTGMVRSLSKRNFHYIMEQRIDRAGYQTVRLQRKTDKGSTQFVHRLLAKTFIENPNAKKCVNHIDGNKLNNDLSNLEWVTHEENIKHAYSIGLMKKNSKPVVDNCSGMLFESIQEACNHSGIHRKTLIGYLNGHRRNPTCMEYMAAA